MQDEMVITGLFAKLHPKRVVTATFYLPPGSTPLGLIFPDGCDVLVMFVRQDEVDQVFGPVPSQLFWSNQQYHVTIGTRPGRVLTVGIQRPRGRRPDLYRVNARGRFVTRHRPASSTGRRARVPIGLRLSVEIQSKFALNCAGP